jgi:hypothetical protein
VHGNKNRAFSAAPLVDYTSSLHKSFFSGDFHYLYVQFAFYSLYSMPIIRRQHQTSS